MSPEEQSPMLPYTEEDKEFVWNELNLDENMVRESVEAITDWFNKQPHLVNAGIDKYCIEKMIIISKGSIEKAKQRIDSYYKYRYLAPEFIQERDMLRDPQSKIWDACVIFTIPKMQNGRRVHFMKFSEDLGMFDITQLFRNCFMYTDIRMGYDYWLTDTWILDLRHITFSHIFTLKPTILRKAALLFQNGLNWRIQAIHVINLQGPTALVQRALDFFGQFFNTLIMSRVLLHESEEDLLKFVPKEYLPEDYGGTAPHTKVFTENMEKEFKRQKTIDFLLDCSRMVSDESRRPRDEYSEENLPGSFRKLEVD